VAPQCVWADALTKVVAIRGDASDPVLARFQATAWLH
jgi:thiamine biosynthesis lipoprotein